MAAAMLRAALVAQKRREAPQQQQRRQQQWQKSSRRSSDWAERVAEPRPEHCPELLFCRSPCQPHWHGPIALFVQSLHSSVPGGYCYRT